MRRFEGQRVWRSCAVFAFVLLMAHGAQAEEGPTKAVETPTEGTSEVVETPIIDVPEVRVEGRRLTEPRHPRSDAREVISREEIEAQHPQALVDLLRERAGVDVRSTGGPGKQTSLRIRGSNTNQIRVYVDDVLVGGTTVGDYNWANLSSQDIDRVEILRGPQTTLYGAGAMGGVVQVYTREAETGLHGGAWAGYGNRGHRQAGVRLSGGTESGIRGAVSVEHSTINGVSAIQPDPAIDSSPEYDPFRNTTTSAHVSVPTGDGRVRMFWRRADAQTELDDFSGDNESYDQDTRQQSFGLDWRQPVTDFWTTRVFLAQHDDRIVGEDPNLLFNNFHIESKRWQASWTHDLVWGDFGFLGGVDLEHDRAVNDGAGIRDSTRRTGLFGQFRYDVERFGASLGLRKEFNNANRDEWTYQLGSRLTLLEGLDLLANFGTAFRAPSLNELYFSGPFSSGNLDLEPERSHGGDLGVRWIGSCDEEFGWQVDLRAFHHSFENLIEFRDQGGFFFQPINVEQARMSGGEATLRFDWKSFWVSTSYTNLRTRDAAGFQLARRSRHAGRLSLGGSWERVRAEVVVHAVGRSFSGARETQPVEGYWTADFHLSVVIHEHLTARLDVTNFTNHGYEEVSGRGTLPRMAFFTLEASF